MSTATSDLELHATRTGLLLVDWQERLLAAMPAELAQRALRNAVLLVEAARRLGLPVILSEQYPKGLGHTVPQLSAALAGLPQLTRFEKLEFGCVGVAPFDQALAASGRTHWIASGVETHVCLYQTTRALARTHRVFVPQDAALSRSEANWRVGLDLMARAGCVITSTETVVFDLLKRAGSDDFRALSKLIK